MNGSFSSPLLSLKCFSPAIIILVMGAGQKPLGLSAGTDFPRKTCHCSKKHKRKLEGSKIKGH